MYDDAGEKKIIPFVSLELCIDMKNTFCNKAIDFFTNLNHPEKLPNGISTMNPYENKETQKIINQFYKKFFDNSDERTFIIGINPGRFGGGLTGIAFTDPGNLEEYCGIKNNLGKNASEMSSRFIYKVIEGFGGTKAFYNNFFLSALYPLALIKDEKNYNYYDSREVYKALKLEIIKTFKQQINFGAKKNSIICLGKKNAKYLKEINNEIDFFEEIIILDHPRYIMQYKFKHIEKYTTEYITTLRSLL